MSAEIAEKQGRDTVNEFEGAGKVGLPSLAEVLGLSLGVSGKYSRTANSDSTAEQKFVREHTLASLFNRLHGILRDSGSITTVSGASDLINVAPGDMIQVRGLVQESPIEVILDAANRVVPFLEFSADKQLESKAKPNRAARRQADRRHQESNESDDETNSGDDLRLGIRILNLLRDDLRESPVSELVVHADDYSALLVASREFFPLASKATIIGGRFEAIGKVTEVITDQEAETNVVRGGQVAGMTPIVELLKDFSESMSQFVQVGDLDTVIKGPCVQIIPLAVFV